MKAPLPTPSRKREIFLQALERPTPQERAAFLDAACGDDAELRSTIEELLAHHTDDAFLEIPAAALEAPDSNAASLNEKPGDRIGRYRLVERIGEGGFGTRKRWG